MFGQRREGLVVNGVESLALCPERRVESAGRLGNRLQAHLTEVRLYELARVVFYEAAAAFAVASAAAKDGLKICTVGVGTANGDLIPIPAERGGGFVKDDSGQFVKSHLGEAGLKSIAEATGGLYAPLGAQGQGLDTIYQQALAPLAKHDLASRRQRVYTERFQWPLTGSLALLLASLFVGTRRRSPRKNQVPASCADEHAREQQRE